MLGQEIKTSPSYVEPERAPTALELDLWSRAQTAARRASLSSYYVKIQHKNLVHIAKFAATHQFALNEPTAVETEKRMLAVCADIERLKSLMCGVENLELGIRMSSSGSDLDIVQPEKETLGLGWILPVVGIAVLVGGIIARWAYLEAEVGEVRAAYNGILKRADMALCSSPDSKMCIDWKIEKSKGDYRKRETILDKMSGAISSIGGAAKSGLGAGLALAIPLLLFMYLPRKKG